ncbi:pentatricopeptide repeat domain-containing protein [Botrytis cinerea]
MRPALQRLISRYSSLNLLRYLVHASNTPPSANIQYDFAGKRCNRNYASIRIGLKAANQYDSQHDSLDTAQPAVRRVASKRASNGSHTVMPHTDTKLVTTKKYNRWKNYFTRGELEYESRVSEKAREGALRLVDNPVYEKDIELWAVLLVYRQRIYGDEGVRVIWEAITTRNIQLPVEGLASWTMWRAFLDLGLEDETVLESIIRYADDLLQQTGQRWNGLYTRLMYHLLMNGRGAEAFQWHRRLMVHHSPEAKAFEKLCFRVITLGEILKLCERFMKEKKDFPKTARPTEDLIRLLTKFRSPLALRVARSLVHAGISIPPGLEHELKDTQSISREMMNLIHGEVFHIKPKKYDDELGARWLATTWVPLDVSIQSIHALGVKEIGPLSFQSIALRDPDTKAVIKRLDQLVDLGISPGQSKFVKAVEFFAREGNQEFVNALVNSDQHPAALDDWMLQEKLLASYAAKEQLTEFRQAMAIRLVGSRTPDFDVYNIHLRICVIRNQWNAVLKTLSDMRINRIPVKPTSISCILRQLLRPRRRGRRPVMDPKHNNFDDVTMATKILTGIMASGSSVPVHHWSEIIRRLGMLGREKELHNLCIFLASWYGSKNHDLLPGVNHLRIRDRTQTPDDLVPKWHHQHPLKRLFPPSLQGAIVEWGFQRALASPSPKVPGFVRASKKIAYNITNGIVLLRELHHIGVEIEPHAIRRAVVNRLVILYGPGRSTVKANRQARILNPLSLEEAIAKIDNCLPGTKMFPYPDAAKHIRHQANMRF